MNYCLVLQVKVKYASGPKQFKISTPWRKKAVKRLARRNFSAMSSAVVSSQSGSRSVITSLAKKMKEEINHLCSIKDETVLSGDLEAVKCFSWESIWLELEHRLPTLMTMLQSLVKYPGQNKPLLCLLASMLLKQRSPKLSLVQKAISVLFHGNGTSKQVSVSL